MELRRRPGVPACRHHAQAAAIGHQTLASLGEFAARWKTSLYEALFAVSLHGALSARAIGSLHEFGRYVNDLEYLAAARQTVGAEDAKPLLLGWLKDIGSSSICTTAKTARSSPRRAGATCSTSSTGSPSAAAARSRTTGSATVRSEAKSVLDVAQTISVIISLAERGDDQDVVTLSTLHAAKGLEWAHVMLAGVNEGLLPFRSGDEDMTAERLEEERRLMYVGITRARRTLVVSTLRRRKRAAT